MVEGEERNHDQRQHRERDGGPPAHVDADVFPIGKTIGMTAIWLQLAARQVLVNRLLPSREGIGPCFLNFLARPATSAAAGSSVTTMHRRLGLGSCGDGCVVTVRFFYCRKTGR